MLDCDSDSVCDCDRGDAVAEDEVSLVAALPPVLLPPALLVLAPVVLETAVAAAV